MSTVDFVQEVLRCCEAFETRRPIQRPKLNELGKLWSYLAGMDSIHWLSATVAPILELDRLGKAAKKWEPFALAKELCLECLYERLGSRFQALLGDVEAAVRSAVRSVTIPHHSCIQTGEYFALSLLVPGWCRDDADLLSAMISVYRAGAIIVSDLVLGAGHTQLARAPIVW